MRTQITKLSGDLNCVYTTNKALKEPPSPSKLEKILKSYDIKRKVNNYNTYSSSGTLAVSVDCLLAFGVSKRFSKSICNRRFIKTTP